MAFKYVRSTDGLDSDDGSTNALAKATLSGAATAAAAGDTVFVSQVHAESGGVTVITSAGTVTSPVKFICGNDAAEPPTAVATTGSVTSTSNITVNGCGYFYGIEFKPGSGGSVTQSFLSGTAGAFNNQYFENCKFNLLTTGTGLAKITIGDEVRTDSNRYIHKNCQYRVGGVNHRIKVAGNFKMVGGSFISGGASPVNIFETGLRGIGEFDVSGLDLSANVGTAFNMIIQNAGGSACLLKFKNIKLPTSWSGSLWSAAPTGPGIRAEMRNSFAGSFKYRVWIYDYMGQVRDNTTVVRTGGASDDGTAFSLKMTSAADAEYPVIPLEGEVLKAYVDSTSSTTMSVEIVHDSQGSGTGAMLRNDEFGFRVVYPGGTFDTFKADALATAADAGITSSATWTTTGLTTPVKQKISFTFTPTSKGDVIITPILYAASKTVYICPLLGA